MKKKTRNNETSLQRTNLCASPLSPRYIEFPLYVPLASQNRSQDPYPSSIDPGGTPPYKLYRYVPPQRVGFLSSFGLILLIMDWNRVWFSREFDPRELENIVQNPSCLNIALFGFPSWKCSDRKIIGIKTYLFENFSQKKSSRKF